jgi:hypothetical protein
MNDELDELIAELEDLLHILRRERAENIYLHAVWDNNWKYVPFNELSIEDQEYYLERAKYESTFI